MDHKYEDQAEYEPDSPEAILRCAIAVACADREFAYDEQQRVRRVYSDICREMTFAYNRPDVSDDWEDIAESTSEIVLSSKKEDDRIQYVKACGALIIDNDLRELTLVMALRIAGGDSYLDAAEFSALKTLADMWL